MTYSLAVHGGAGSIDPGIDQKKYIHILEKSVSNGFSVLKKGGTALDAVTASILVLEDSPLFNAGCGAVLNAGGFAQLDASIMDGKTRNSGGVSAATKIRNPILACRKVMEKSKHVLLTTKGANMFAEEHGLDMVENDYFLTKPRQEQLARLKKTDNVTLDFDTDNDAKGTVGAVALDIHGNLAAGTSTGGMANKAIGRVGDSPNIGHGNYAENDVCAISATGTGEEISRVVMAHDIACQIKYAKVTPENATKSTLKAFSEIGGDGGLIMITADGEIHFPFISKGMFRGSCSEKKSNIFTSIF